MIQGCEHKYPPGRSIQTDRQCSNSDFCDFLDSDALQSGVVQDDTFICTGCNDIKDWGEFSLTDWDTIRRSRNEQMPNGWT